MTHLDSKRGEISLAELIQALHELPRETQDQTEAIFHALGFNWQNSKPAGIEKNQKKEVYDRNRYRAKPSASKKSSNDSSLFSAPPTPELPIELPKNIVRGNLKPISADAEEDNPKPPPAWLNQEGYQLLTESVQTEIPPQESLFPTQTHRGILGAALTVKKTGQDINMSALINQVIKGRIPRVLPKNSNSTLELGCQLFLDYNDGMVPFWEDLTALARQIEHLIGNERVKIYEFDQNPTRAQHWTPPAQAKKWQPEPGRPVIVASNLNITGHRRQSPVNPYWQTFFKQCKQLNIPLLLLIPWQRSYWPSDLGSHPIPVHWNPATTATMIYSLVGKGHRVNP